MRESEEEEEEEEARGRRRRVFVRSPLKFVV